MNLKEYMFYKQITPQDLAINMDLHPNYVRTVLRGKMPLTKSFSYAIEILTKGVVKHSNVFGPPSYPNLEIILNGKS